MLGRWGRVVCLLVLLAACSLVLLFVYADKGASHVSGGWVTRSAWVYSDPNVLVSAPDDRTKVRVEIQVTVIRGDWVSDPQYERLVLKRDVRRLFSDTRGCGAIAESIADAMTATIKGEPERPSPPCAGIDLDSPNTFKPRL